MPKESEYEALRNELLVLETRAHDVWRWGLVVIVALLGTEFVTLSGILGQSQAEGETNQLAELVKNWSVPIGAMLCAGSAGAAIMLWRLFAHVRQEMHRLGAYLAVFHDDPGNGVPEDTRALGWHVWNRLDKHKGDDLQLRDQPASEMRPFHGTGGVYMAAVTLQIACTIGLFGGLAGAGFRFLGVIGVVAIIAVGTSIWFLEKRTRQSVVKWNKRWISLARMDRSSIESCMVAVGLRCAR